MTADANDGRDAGANASAGPSSSDASGSDWLTDACAEVARDPDSVTRAFAFAARRVGRAPRRPDVDPGGVVHGTVDDAARAALVVALADAVGTGPDYAERLVRLYRQGDAAERRGVLRGLDALARRGDLDAADLDAANLDTASPGASDPGASGPSTTDPGTADPSTTPLVAAGLDLAADALRANDPGLVAAAVGPFGSRHLDQHTWRHAILKLVFQGVSLDAVSDLGARADDELARMARDFAAERRAAGRSVPTDLDRLTSTSTTPPSTELSNTRPSSNRPSSTKE